MSDLDDEELEATRRLNGVDKKDSIEKDIKRCEELIKPEHANWIGISNQLAIAHVVDRVKEVENDLTTVYLKGYADAEEKYRKRIKELEQENRSKQKAYDDCYCEYKHYKQFDAIPVQKVKDLKESVILDNTIVGGRRNSKTLEYGIKLGKIKACEELLEDK